ncbi:hypothetical protein SAMN05660226_02332 [Parapedobacter luteus]|uniref:Uncharacterized protein n=1 Tax=Parapedobacter luteus TaxID=623280 RepID=A0A1T5CTG8_9SPHI|nr:hypothetical protein SAMN05660226_02332 [Parapedobacter luteus]
MKTKTPNPLTAFFSNLVAGFNRIYLTSRWYKISFKLFSKNLICPPE